jgi:ABC-type sugar transport system ATPase subunit
VLDVSLEHVAFSFPHFALRDVTLTFPKSSHTAVTGPPGAGASTLLQLVAGGLRPTMGTIRIGARDVTALRAGRRPLLYATSAIDGPGRWSVWHLLIAAVRQRTLDRIDRQRELELAADRWGLASLLDRKIATLSHSERVTANLARIELLRPGILIADRLLDGLNPSALPSVADQLYRTLRVIGATVISAAATSFELGLADSLVVLDAGRVVQRGTPAEIHRMPASEAAARATGEVSVVPVEIRGQAVESVMGGWELPEAPFQGMGIALARPEDFTIARAGEESDVIFGIEEASFSGGRWIVRGMLSGGVELLVSLPADVIVHKGRLLPLRYDPRRFTLLPSNRPPVTMIPTDVVPSLSESR